MSNTICPFQVNNNFFPILKPSYGSTNNYPVHNAIFTANAIAWAIQMAEESGINSDKGGK